MHDEWHVHALHPVGDQEVVDRRAVELRGARAVRRRTPVDGGEVRRDVADLHDLHVALRDQVEVAAVERDVDRDRRACRSGVQRVGIEVDGRVVR